MLHRNNLQAAWKRVRANKGAAGIDGMTIDEFPAWVKSGNWKAATTDLETGRYQPSPVRRVEIDKPDGGKRQLGIPTVTDRVIQQAIAQALGNEVVSFTFESLQRVSAAVDFQDEVFKSERSALTDLDSVNFFIVLAKTTPYLSAAKLWISARYQQIESSAKPRPLVLSSRRVSPCYQ